MMHLTDQNTDNDSQLVYRIVEVKLEHIADNILSSKNNPDNILQDIHHTIERIFITSAMRLKNNNVTQAAKLLGINRNTLSKKLKELGHDDNSI
jgi:DNA-binding protein Fis